VCAAGARKARLYATAVLYRSVLLNLGGQILTLAIGFFPSILVARWLGPTDRGLLGIIATTSAIAFVLASVGLPAAVLYFSSEKNPATAALLGNSILFTGFLTLAFLAPTWFFRHDIAALLSHHRGEVAWVVSALTIPATFLDWTTHNQLLGRLRFGYYNALIVVSKVVFLVIVILCLQVLDLGVSGVFVAMISASLLVVGGALRVILREALPSFDWNLFRQMFAYGRKSQFGSIFQFLNSRFDVLILQFFVPLAAVGYYVVAQLLGELVMVLTRAFQSSVTPLVTRDFGDSASQSLTTSSSLRHHGLLCGAAIVLDAAFAPVLVVFGYGHGFLRALVPFFIILPGIWFLATGLLIANDLNGRNRPGLASRLSGLAVAITVTLDLLLIPWYGVTGAAIASLIGYVAFGIVSLIVESHVAGIAWQRLLPTAADLRLYPSEVRRALVRFRATPSTSADVGGS
jgi:O-antigen/teichoic acid export membrane protein